MRSNDRIRQPCKIAYIVDEIVGQTAGTESQLLSLISKLPNSEFEPHLVVLRPSHFLNNFATSYHVEYLHIHKLFSFSALRSGIKLTRYLYENGIRLTHIFFNDSSIFAPFFCKIAGAKVIVSRRDLGFWYTPLKLVLLKMNRLFVDRVITNSRAVRDVVCNKEGYSSEKICVIYNGVTIHSPLQNHESETPNSLISLNPTQDKEGGSEWLHNGQDLNRFRSSSRYDLRVRFNIPPDAPIIGMVANFHKYKRHEDLIDAFSVVHKEKPETHLVLIGYGARAKELKNRVAVLDLNQVVHFTGELPDAIPIIREFSVCVLCSSTEGFSNALLEYMACGKPVVTTKVGGNLEIIENGLNGLLIPIGDVGSLARAILCILNDADAGEKLGSFARATICRRFSRERMIAEYASLYRRILQ